MDYNALIESAKKAALLAGREILSIYETGDFSIEAKADHSPLTKADKAAHEVIVRELEHTNLPVLSEEGKAIPYEQRKDWDYFWMIDPLDGTKEFIKKNGEFTVNIALVHRAQVVAGVVYAPVLGWLYWSIPGAGAFKSENDAPPVRIKAANFDAKKSGIKVVASRSHMSTETAQFIQGLVTPDLVSMGSSLKILLVAEGKADVYPRFAPTMEWDTAAAHGVAIEAGAGVFLTDQTTPLRYNKPDLLNPHFIVLGGSE